MHRTTPVINPGSNLNQHIGAEIADYVRSDLLAVTVDLVHTLAGRGCSNFAVQIWDGLTISRIANEAKSFKNRIIPVGGFSCSIKKYRDGGGGLGGYIYWYIDADAVSPDWDDIHRVVGEGWD